MGWWGTRGYNSQADTLSHCRIVCVWEIHFCAAVFAKAFHQAKHFEAPWRTSTSTVEQFSRIRDVFSLRTVLPSAPLHACSLYPSFTRFCLYLFSITLSSHIILSSMKLPQIKEEEKENFFETFLLFINGRFTFWQFRYFQIGIWSRNSKVIILCVKSSCYYEFVRFPCNHPTFVF